MDINFRQGNPLEITSDCLIVGIFEGEEFSSDLLNEANQAFDNSLEDLNSILMGS